MNTPSTPAYLRDSTMTGPPESEAEAAGYPALSHAESLAVLRQHLSEQDSHWNTIARGFQTSNASGDGTGLRVEMVPANLPTIFPGERYYDGRWLGILTARYGAGADDDGGGDVADAVVSAPDSAAKDRTTARSRAAPGVEEA